MQPFSFPQNKIFFVAEAGVNHQGDLTIAKQLIDAAVEAGADAIKWQKRTPLMCVPPHLWDVQRQSPWGIMTHKE